MITHFAIALTLALVPDNTPDPQARPNFGMMGMEQAEDGLPPFEDIAEGFDAVISSVDGNEGLYTLYRDEDDHLLD